MRLLLALSLALVAAAPARAPVISFDPATDFSHFHSYSWVFKAMPGGMNPNLYRQIRVAVDRSLTAHGFVKSDAGDFAVAFTLGPRANMHPADYGHFAPYYSAEEATAHQDWVNRELAERSSHDHTLAIDIYDNYSKHSVWSRVGARARTAEHAAGDRRA